MPTLCSEDELGYERSRTVFIPGAGLALDETYRLAHLPLIAPEHPSVIPRRDGTFYQMGRHPRMFSLVLPVPAAALRDSPGYRELEAELRTTPFAPKIAWRLLNRRWDRLHATVCGSLSEGEPPELDQAALNELAHVGPIEVELRGLFSGNVNVGRLYFAVYPERRDSENLFHRVQRILGRRETDLYVVGIYNLVDDLDPDEAAALESVIQRWRDRPILRFSADCFWLLGAMDDLVLDGSVERTIPLTSKAASR